MYYLKIFYHVTWASWRSSIATWSVFFCQKHVRERSKNLLTNHQGSRVLVTRFSLLIFVKDSFTRHFFPLPSIIILLLIRNRCYVSFLVRIKFRFDEHCSFLTNKSSKSITISIRQSYITWIFLPRSSRRKATARSKCS